MTRIKNTLNIFLILAMTVFAHGIHANTFSLGNNIEATAEPDFLPVEQAYQLDLELNNDSLTIAWILEKNYFLYRHGFENKLITGEETLTLTPDIPKGIEKQDEYFGLVEIYYGQVVYEIPLPEADTFKLKTSSQGCADAGLCYPPYHQYFEITASTRTIKAISADAFRSPTETESTDLANETPAQAPVKISLIAALISAFIGGLILNLMPCVFPVLSIKVIQLARQHDAATTRLHGLIYMAGVVLSFLLIAGLMLGLKNSGEAIGWGFQLQNAWFVALLVYLFFLLGLNMLGWINPGAQFMGAGHELTEKDGAKGAFFTGVLAVVVASPCTAPFMGSALGYAIGQSTSIALLTFAALGLGMAFPLTLVSMIPAAAKIFPKPGLWMDRLKQFFSFPLFATAIWLSWVLANQTSTTGSALILIGCLLISMSIWLWKTHNKLARSLSLALVAVILFIPFSSSLEQKGEKKLLESGHVAFTQAGLDQLRKEGKPVFIDLTADWCITCIANEKSTLETEEVQKAFKDAGIVYMIGDWTDYNPEITELLSSYHRSGIPLYLLYPPRAGARATVLPQLLTKSIVLKAIENNK